MINITAILIGAAAGAAFKPLSDTISRKLLEARSRVFKDDKTSFLIQLAISAGLGAGIGWRSGLTLNSVFLLTLLFSGNIISTTDIQYRIIPNEMVLTIAGIRIIFGVLSFLKIGDLPVWNPLMSLAGFAVLTVIFILPTVTGGKIGMGDLKLAMAIGFASGLMPALIAICLMGMLVLLYGAVQRHYAFQAFLKSSFPMGPFLCAAQVLAFLIN